MRHIIQPHERSNRKPLVEGDPTKSVSTRLITSDIKKLESIVKNIVIPRGKLIRDIIHDYLLQSTPLKTTHQGVKNGTKQIKRKYV